MIWIAMLLGAVGAGWLFGHGNAAANAHAAAESAPRDLLEALLGVTLGLYARDRIRLRRTYASPSLAYLSKSCFFCCASPFAAWILSPIAWPVELPHLFVAGLAVSAAGWIGNLPSKL